MNTRRQHELDDDVDETGVIRDGGRVRVPLYLTDSTQRAVAEAAAAANRRRSGGFHQPGFIVGDAAPTADTAAARERRAQAYAMRELADQQAWKRGADPRPGDEVEIRGRRYQLVESGGQLTIEPVDDDDPKVRAAVVTTRLAMARERDENAWRRPGQGGRR